MDIPDPFKTDKDETIQDLITVKPFAAIISSIDNKIVAAISVLLKGWRVSVPEGCRFYGIYNKIKARK